MSQCRAGGFQGLTDPIGIDARADAVECTLNQGMPGNDPISEWKMRHGTALPAIPAS